MKKKRKSCLKNQRKKSSIAHCSASLMTLTVNSSPRDRPRRGRSVNESENLHLITTSVTCCVNKLRENYVSFSHTIFFSFSFTLTDRIRLEWIGWRSSHSEQEERQCNQIGCRLGRDRCPTERLLRQATHHEGSEKILDWEPCSDPNFFASETMSRER